jgi:signal transduction histidine kinase
VRPLFRSSSLRLAAVYTIVFAFSVLVLGAITLAAARAELGHQFESRIRSESASLTREYQLEGLQGILDAVRERDTTPGALDYGLQSPTGAAIAGKLAMARAPAGWSVVTTPKKHGGAEDNRVFATPLPGGYRLLVGDDADRAEALDGVLLRSFALAFLGVIVLGVGGGYGLSRGVHRRLGSINGTAEAIINGDLSRRVPVSGVDDDLGRLAITLNRMLDRIQGLMESVKQVSSDIAHDLRTPLTRLRQKLEIDRHGDAIESALGDLDAILDTFAALLRIAQIESGARRAAFGTVDLAVTAATVVDAFAPSAEDAGATLRLEAAAPLPIDGDPELLTQMLVNLVENALRHGGPGVNARVICHPLNGAATVSVIDNGQGVPAQGRERLFDRFHRLEASRSTPGNGLGLALVAAVVKLHGAEITLLDANPGLEARVVFPVSA